jgi:hypothetical protein
VSSNDTNRREVIDAEHLRLLMIFHFVSAGLAFIGFAFALLYNFLFETVFANPDFWTDANQPAPPQQFVGVFRWVVGAFAVWFLASALLNLFSGMFLRSRRYRTFSMVVAGLNCLHIPLGTALGIFTFIVLGRDSVRQLYEARNADQSPPYQ